MPAPTPPSFSYASAALLLRSSRASALQKIDVARDLLSRTLIPSPTSLILDHVFYALKNSTSIPHSSLADYWQLLHNTLQKAARQSEHVPEFPDALIQHASTQILHPTCTKAVAQALFTLFNYPLPQSLQAYGTLLQNIAFLLPHNAHLHALAFSVLRAYQQIQRQHHDHKSMISVCIPLLEPFLSSPELRKCAEPVFRHAFFAEPNIPRDALISFLSESTCEHLPTISTFLLTAYTEAEHNRTESLNERNRPATQKGSSHLKRGRQHLEKPHVLRFFQDMLCALSFNLVNQQAICLPRVQSVRAAFIAACDLHMYRPSMEDLSLIQSEKRSKKNNHTFGVHTVATQIRNTFALVCTLIEQLSPEEAEPGHAMTLFEAAAAMIKLSVDTVDDLVPKLLLACGQGPYADERRMLFAELLEVYASTRTVPTLLSHFKQAGRSVLNMYESTFEHDHVLYKLALTIYRLPQGQAEECITVIAGEKLPPDQVQVVAFLSALVLENSGDSKAQLIQCVCDNVVRKILSCKESAQSRCALLYVLSSVIFSILKAGLAKDVNTIQTCLNSGILQSVCGFPFSIDDVDDFENKLVCMLEKQERVVETCETYCTLRLLAALVHYGVRAERVDEDHAMIRRLLNLIFERVERLEATNDEEGEWLSPFYNSLRFHKVVAVVVSVLDIMDLAMADQAPPGFVRFLAALAVREGEYAGLWMDMLEKRVIQESFAEVVLFVLKGKGKTSDEEQHVLGALRLILQTPHGYMEESDERRVAKAVVHQFPSLREDVTQAKALEVVLKLWRWSGSKLQGVVEECAVRGVNDGILARLSEGAEEAGRIREKADAKEGSKKLVAIAESVLQKWCGEYTQLKGAQAFLRNVDVALQSANVNSKIVRLALKRLAAVVGSISSDCRRLLSGNNEREGVGDALATVCVVLRIWDELDRNAGAARKSGRRAIEGCTRLLRNNVELAFGRSVGWLTQHGKGGVGPDTAVACRELLKCCCRYVAGRRERVTGSTKRASLLLHTQVASAWHLLLSEDATVRTVGAEMMSDLCTYESDAVVDMIGTTVCSELEREAGRRAEHARAKHNGDVAEALTRLRGQSMAAAAVLCGARAPCEKETLMVDDEGRFTGFEHVRQRRELGGIRLSRELSARMVLRVMEGAEWAVEMVAGGTDATGTRAMEEAARWTLLLTLAAVETAVARRAPRRLPAHAVQAVVAWLSAVLRYDGDGAGRVVARATHVCRHLLRAHAHALRWGCAGALRHAARRAAELRAADGAVAAEPLRDALRQLAAGGDGAVNAAAGDECCHALRAAHSGALRRDALRGVAALLTHAERDGVQRDARRALPLAHGANGAAEQVARAALALRRAARYRGR